MLGRAIRFFLKPPSERAEHRSAIRGFREPPGRARGAYFAPGELGERLIARGAQGTARCVGGEATGACFFWFLFFARAKKRNLPWVSHPQVAFYRRRSRHNMLFCGLRQNFPSPPYINYWVQGRSYPQLAFEIARKARDNI